jgi:heme-degrading monooxygenase HmoA
MYAVIFRATIKHVDDEYLQTAERMRELAKRRYGCEDFVSLQEGDQEIAISYWHSVQDIQAWKDDPEHRRAQALGKTRWYQSYRVEVVQVVRNYQGKSEHA